MCKVIVAGNTSIDLKVKSGGQLQMMLKSNKFKVSFLWVEFWILAYEKDAVAWLLDRCA